MNAAFFRSRFWRTALFASGHILACALAYFVLVAPVVDVFQTIQDGIEEKKSSLTKLQDSYARLIGAVNSEQNQDNTNNLQYLSGGNEGAVAAALLGNLKIIVEPAGVSLRSVRSLQARDTGKLSEVGARIEIAGEMTSILRALYNIESTNAPALFVEGAILRVLPGGGAPNAPVPPQIEAQFDIYGVLRERGPS